MKVDNYDKLTFIKVSKKQNKFKLTSDKNYKLCGFYQSEKYFIEHKDKILDLFSIDEKYMEKIKDIYENIKGVNKITVSLHIRRGDYLKLSHLHTNLTISYYNKATKLFNKEVLYIIFSDDIEWCKKNIKYSNIYFCEDIPDIGLPLDITELILMSMCDNNIIANSIFSWWGAWLNRNENKKVIAPRKWFMNDMMNFKNRKIYCDGWIVMCRFYL